MCKLKTIVLGIGILVLLTAMAFYVARDNDPEYQGKPLSKHLEAFTANGISLGGVSKNPGEMAALTVPGVTPRCSDQQAREALERVGTNALPMLVRMLKSKDTRFRRWIWETVEGHQFLKKHIHMKPPTAGFARQLRALAAFHELGPLAAPAIPRIIPILNDPDNVLAAISALTSIHPQRESDILSLTNVFRIQAMSISGAPPALNCSAALLALSTFGPNAKGATPILLDCLHSPNGRVRACAAIALVRVRAPAQTVVPLILAAMPKTNPFPGRSSFPFTAAGMAQRHRMMEDYENLQMSLFALSEYGQQAQSALPILSNLQSYPVLNVQEAARDAAAKIKASR